MMTVPEAEDLALRLLKLNGLPGWSIKFWRSPSRAGSCEYPNRTLWFSSELLEKRTRSGSRDTVAHEVAHAIAGQVEDHGPLWERVSQRLGGSGQPFWQLDSLTVDPQSLYRWVYHCSTCGEELGKTIAEKSFPDDTTVCCRGKIGTKAINA